MLIQKRDIAVGIILSIITCGIYSIYWFCRITDEVNYLSGDTDATTGGMAFIFSLVTCGIYTLFWMYKMGDKLDDIALSQGRPASSRPVIYLLLAIFGFSIVSFALMQDSINKSI